MNWKSITKYSKEKNMYRIYTTTLHAHKLLKLTRLVTNIYPKQWYTFGPLHVLTKTYVCNGVYHTCPKPFINCSSSVHVRKATQLVLSQ